MSPGSPIPSCLHCRCWSFGSDKQKPRTIDPITVVPGEGNAATGGGGMRWCLISRVASPEEPSDCTAAVKEWKINQGCRLIFLISFSWSQHALKLLKHFQQSPSPFLFGNISNTGIISCKTRTFVVLTCACVRPGSPILFGAELGKLWKLNRNYSINSHHACNKKTSVAPKKSFRGIQMPRESV